jgi:hypothetical protein
MGRKIKSAIEIYGTLNDASMDADGNIVLFIKKDSQPEKWVKMLRSEYVGKEVKMLLSHFLRTRSKKNE